MRVGPGRANVGSIFVKTGHGDEDRPPLMLWTRRKATAAPSSRGAGQDAGRLHAPATGRPGAGSPAN